MRPIWLATVRKNAIPACEIAMLIGVENCCRIELADSAEEARL
jgi:hypothetical protein